MMITIRPADDQDTSWRDHLLTRHWGSTSIVSRGQVHIASTLPAFIGLCDEQTAGLITYYIEDQECQIISLNSECENLGIGTALLQTVIEVAAKSLCRRVWLITTNDNLAALRFYQKRGFTIVDVHRNALEISRQLKPEIPLVGMDGIPLRDEIELELVIHDSNR